MPEGWSPGQYMDVGIGLGLFHGLLSETWRQPPTPVPSDVVDLKVAPKSNRLMRTGVSMVKSSAVLGGSLVVFAAGKDFSASFFGPGSSLSYAFGGALGGAALSCRNKRVINVPRDALLGAASGLVFSFFPDHHRILEENHGKIHRGPRYVSE